MAAGERAVVSRHVLPETRALAALGLFDLLTSVYVIASHRADEANPLFSALLHRYGPWGFVAGKALLLAVPLAIAEYARAHRPRFVQTALRVGIVMYVVLLVYAYYR